MKVPNIINDCDSVEELPISAIPINPNNFKRVKKVLDHVLETIEVSGRYSTKLIIQSLMMKKLSGRKRLKVMMKEPGF